MPVVQCVYNICNYTLITDLRLVHYINLNLCNRYYPLYQMH